jgi:hypothetical protein
MKNRDSYQLMSGSYGRPEHQDKMQRLLEEAPGPYHDGNLVEIRIVPFGGVRMDQAGPSVTMQCHIDNRGGVETLRWQLERMVSDLIEAKSKGFIEAEGNQKASENIQETVTKGLAAPRASD